MELGDADDQVRGGRAARGSARDLRAVAAAAAGSAAAHLPPLPQVFGRTKSGSGTGTVGFLTRDLISRTDYYDHTVCLALIPFLNEEHYPGCSMRSAFDSGSDKGG